MLKLNAGDAADCKALPCEAPIPDWTSVIVSAKHPDSKKPQEKRMKIFLNIIYT